MRQSSLSKERRNKDPRESAQFFSGTVQNRRVPEATMTVTTPEIDVQNLKSLMVSSLISHSPYVAALTKIQKIYINVFFSD